MISNRNALMLGLAALVGLSIGIYLNHPPGYCFEERRVIPDEQFLEWALLSLKPRMKLDGSEVSIQTYLEKHPGCCEISRGGLVFSIRIESTALSHTNSTTKNSVVAVTGITLKTSSGTPAAM